MFKPLYLPHQTHLCSTHTPVISISLEPWEKVTVEATALACSTMVPQPDSGIVQNRCAGWPYQRNNCSFIGRRLCHYRRGRGPIFLDSFAA